MLKGFFVAFHLTRGENKAASWGTRILKVFKVKNYKNEWRCETETDTMKSYALKLEEAKTLPDIFEIVKDVVRKVMNTGRAGLTLGLAEMGGGENCWIGAFYPVGSTTIVMNKTSLRRISETDPQLFNAYAFHVLLHEYIHSLGYIDEKKTLNLVYWISREIFSEDHIVTQMAIDISKFFPNLTYPTKDYNPVNLEKIELEMIADFDRSSINYIL